MKEIKRVDPVGSGGRMYDLTTNVISGVIGVFSPVRAVRYRVTRAIYAMQAKRSYIAASKAGSNQGWIPANTTGDAELRVAAGFTRSRARDLIRNNEYVAGAVRTFKANVIGSGIRPQAAVSLASGNPHKRINKQIEALWEKYAKAIKFYEKQELVVSHILSDGEVLAKMAVDDVGKGLPPLKIQMLECDQLDDMQDGLVLRNGNVIRRGVEVDKYGDPVSYHLLDYHPGDYAGGGSRFHSIAVPAGKVLHVFQKDRITSTRGISWMHAILTGMYDLGEYQDYEMVGAKVAAAFGVFIKSPFTVPFREGISNEEVAGDGTSKMQYIEPGRIERLLPGEEIQIASHKRPGSSYHPFVQSKLRGAAVGLGLSYETFSGDYSNATFSSARSALLEERRKYRMFQRMLIEQFCQPIYARFVRMCAIYGLVTLPGYVNDPERFEYARWQAPGWEWIDPLKDAAAAKAELEIGVTTRQKIAASRGEEYEDIFDQLQREEELAIEKKLVFTVGSTAIKAAPPNPVEDEPVNDKKATNAPASEPEEPEDGEQED